MWCGWSCLIPGVQHWCPWSVAGTSISFGHQAGHHHWSLWPPCCSRNPWLPFSNLGPFSIDTFSAIVSSYWKCGNVMIPKISHVGYGELEILSQAHPWALSSAILNVPHSTKMDFTWVVRLLGEAHRPSNTHPVYPHYYYPNSPMYTISWKKKKKRHEDRWERRKKRQRTEE